MCSAVVQYNTRPVVRCTLHKIHECTQTDTSAPELPMPTLTRVKVGIGPRHCTTVGSQSLTQKWTRVTFSPPNPQSDKPNPIHQLTNSPHPSYPTWCGLSWAHPKSKSKTASRSVQPFFAKLTARSRHTLQWAAPPLRNCPFPWGIWTPV